MVAAEYLKGRSRRRTLTIAKKSGTSRIEAGLEKAGGGNGSSCGDDREKGMLDDRKGGREKAARDKLLR